MPGTLVRRGVVILCCAAVALSLGGLVLATNPNEREVKPEANVQDTDDISAPDSKVWVLDFKFKDPRIIKVDVPGRGEDVALVRQPVGCAASGSAERMRPAFSSSLNSRKSSRSSSL